MATPLRELPGLCEVCGVFFPFNAKRPKTLHVCPGYRVVPSLRVGYGRLVVLVGEYKAAVRAGSELHEDRMEELGQLLEEHQDKYPEQRLRNWSERWENRQAIVALAEAGATVLRTYAAYMQDGFAQAVRDQFVDRKVDQEIPCTCFVWHHSEAAWKHRFAVLGLTKPAGEASAMTPFWDGQEVLAGEGVLADKYPPLNRSIEFPDPKPDTLTHEMIHWCTSVEYDRRSNALRDNDRAMVREGTTEWLKRNATGRWEEGGYTDVIPRMQQVIESGAITPQQLMEAYFGGQNVQTVIDAILASYHAENDRRGKVALADTNSAERKRVSGLLPDRRFGMQRSADWRNHVAKTFAGLGEADLAEQVKNQGWLKYLRARAAGSDDNAALTAART